MSRGGFEGGLAVEAHAAPGFAATQALAVRWEGGEVTECAPAVPATSTTSTTAARASDVIDAEGMLVLPGLVCGHVQLGSAFLAGFPSRRGESEEARARRVADAHDAESLAAAARVAALDAAKAGVTVLFDLWRGKFVEGSLDVIAAAVEEIGLRAALAVDVDESRGVDAAKSAIRENVRFAEAARPRMRAMMGIGNPAALDATLAEAVREARQHEMAMHVLLGAGAEARRKLAERAALRPDSIGVVVEPLEDDERALLRDLHVWPVITPRSDAARHRAPHPLTGYGARALLGGWESVADVLAEKSAASAMRSGSAGPAFEEPAAFSLLARGYDLAAATFDEPFGRFAPGSPADFVLFDAPIVAALAPATLPAHLARLAARHVRHVVCAGEVIVRDGRSTRVDEAEVRAKAREQARRVWARAA